MPSRSRSGGADLRALATSPLRPNARRPDAGRAARRGRIAGRRAGAAGAPTPPTIAGCPVFPASSVWNQPVDKLPVAKDSATLIASIGLDSSVHADFGSGLYDGQRIGIPYIVVSGSKTPKSKPHFDYADESDPGPYPIPSTVPIEGDPEPGRRRPPRAHRRPGHLHALRALCASAGRQRLGRGLGGDLEPPLEPPAPGDLDLGGRRRPADPARASPATTRSPPARSTMRFGSPRRGPGGRSSIRRATRRATRTTPRCPRWACAYG